MFPHAHYLGRKWEIFAVEPTARKAETLLKISDWDFHWKQDFEFQTPVILKKGTVIHALAEYDNTLKNLANPSEPPREMSWGKRMYEEMFLVFFTFTPHFDKKAEKSCFEILPTATNIIELDFTLIFQTEKAENLSFEIRDFKGERVLQLFENQAFKKGKHSLKLDLSNLPKGNYYFWLKGGDNVRQRIFSFIDEHLFD